MKRSLLTWAWLVIACACFSQTGIPPRASDTICVPVSQVQAALRAGDSLIIAQRLSDSALKASGELQSRIRAKDATISDFKKAAVVASAQISTLQADKSNLLAQVKLQSGNTDYYQGLLKKQKTKTTLAIIGGALATLAITLVALKH